MRNAIGLIFFFTTFLLAALGVAYLIYVDIRKSDQKDTGDANASPNGISKATDHNQSNAPVKMQSAELENKQMHSEKQKPEADSQFSNDKPLVAKEVDQQKHDLVSAASVQKVVLDIPSKKPGIIASVAKNYVDQKTLKNSQLANDVTLQKIKIVQEIGRTESVDLENEKLKLEVEKMRLEVEKMRLENERMKLEFESKKSSTLPDS